MEKHLSKLQPHQEETLAHHHQQHTQSAREFATPEEMLRCDAGQTVVPPQVLERLRDSLAREPQPRRPWWKRWFRRE
jgi:hypothetical protein